MRMMTLLLLSAATLAQAQPAGHSHYRHSERPLILDLYADSKGVEVSCSQMKSGEIVWRAFLRRKLTDKTRYAAGDVKLAVGDQLTVEGIEAAAGSYILLTPTLRLELAKKTEQAQEEALRKARDPANTACNAEQRKALIKWRVQWLHDLKAAARAAVGREHEAPEEHPAYWMAMARGKAARARYLAALAAKVSDAAEGRYSDGNGGILLLMSGERGRLRFRVECRRGPTAHSGRLEGLAQLDEEQRAAVYKDDEGCQLDLRFDGGRLQLSGQQTGAYHGARAYFDGLYVRVGPLTDAERLALIKLKR